MQILVEPGSYSCLNFGDVAMLQVTVERLWELWPEARIRIVTRDCDLLGEYCPGTEGVDEAQRRLWLEGRSLPGRMGRRFPRLGRAIWVRWPGLAGSGVRWKRQLRGREAGDPGAFLREIRSADLLVVSGRGGWNDVFWEHALGTFEVLEAAQRAGVVTAAFGQGIGPMEGKELWERAGKVLPGLWLLGLRESRMGPDLAERLGVPKSRVVVTGDDAVEFAYKKRRPEMGKGLGVSLRVSAYSGAGGELAGAIGEELRGSARALGATLVPAPISQNVGDSDVETIRRLLAGAEDLTEGALRPGSPEELVQQVGLCRVMIAGSYHAAVFALAQGIPVLCLSKSEYYDGKFLGLAGQFGNGCVLMRMDEAEFPNNLRSEIRRLWDQAEDLRSGLVERAAEQVETGRQAYRRLAEIAG